MAPPKLRKQPSSYPFLPFHLIRATQLLASLIVSAILLYFCYHLKHDHYTIPWTFLVLLTVSLLTLVSQTGTIVLYCCRSLNPSLNLSVNAFLTLLWMLGFSLLSWAMSGTLTHKCDIASWQDGAGIMVCRLYKTLFTFCLTGLISTSLALVLDIIVRKRQLSRGTYVPANNPPTGKPNGSGPSGFLLAPAAISGLGGKERGPGKGYAAPVEQEGYSDTGYTGYSHHT